MKSLLISTVLTTIIMTSAASASCIKVGASPGGSLDEYRARADNMAGAMFYDGKCYEITGNQMSAAALMVSRLRPAYAEAADAAAWGRAHGMKIKSGHPFRVCARAGVKLFFHTPGLSGADANLKGTVRMWIKRSGGGSTKIAWNASKPTKATSPSAVGISVCK